MNREHLRYSILLLLATACFIQPLLAEDALSDSLANLDQDVNQSNTASSSNTSDDYAKRALAAANFSLATQLSANGQLADALNKYLFVTQTDPGYIPAYTRIALIYIKQDKYQQATDFLTEKETSFPDSAEIQSILSYLALQQGNQEKALNYALKANQLNPESISAYNLLAQCYLNQNRNDQIPTLIAKSLSVNSERPDFYTRLGELWSHILSRTNPLSEKEIATQTLPFYEKAYTLTPANNQLAFRLGQLQFELENYPQALRYYEQTYQKAPRTLGLRERMSICYLTLKKTDLAISVLENLLEDYPERKNLYPMIAELYGRDNQWDKAVNYYRLYTQLGSADAQDYANLANAQIQAKHPTDALETLTQAEQNYPNIPNLRFYQALVLRNLKRWQESLDIFQALEKQNSKLIDSNFYFDYAITYEKSGDQTKAVELFRKSLSLNPNNDQALNYLGYMWADKGENLDEAEQLITKALTLDPESPAYLDSMAWVCYQKKQYDKALEYQQKAIAGMPDDPEVLEHLADIYYKLGNTEKAIESWSKASLKATDPESLKAKIQSAKEQLQASLQQP